MIRQAVSSSAVVEAEMKQSRSAFSVRLARARVPAGDAP